MPKTPLSNCLVFSWVASWGPRQSTRPCGKKKANQRSRKNLDKMAPHVRAVCVSKLSSNPGQVSFVTALHHWIESSIEASFACHTAVSREWLAGWQFPAHYEDEGNCGKNCFRGRYISCHDSSGPVHGNTLHTKMKELNLCTNTWQNMHVKNDTKI